MVPHMNELLPLIIDTLQDQGSTSKREVALHTLGLLAKSTGYVVTPFLRNAALLDIFLHLIKTERAPLIRREIVKVLGIVVYHFLLLLNIDTLCRYHWCSRPIQAQVKPDGEPRRQSFHWTRG